MAILTAADIEAAIALAERATPGPWRNTWGDEPHPDFGETCSVEAVGRSGIERLVVGSIWWDGPHVACRENDSEFIAAARTLVPQLCAELKAARAEVERLKGELESIHASQFEERFREP